MKTLLVPEYHTLKYTKKVKIPQEGSQPVSNKAKNDYPKQELREEDLGEIECVKVR